MAYASADLPVLNFFDQPRVGIRVSAQTRSQDHDTTCHHMLSGRNDVTRGLHCKMRGISRRKVTSYLEAAPDLLAGNEYNCG